MNNGTTHTVNPLAPAMMATYSQLMKQFLDVQRDVMIAALQGGDFDAAQIVDLPAYQPATLVAPPPPAPVIAPAPPPVPAPAVNGTHAPAPVAPPPAPAPAAQTAAPTPTGDITEAVITDALVDIVAERTGYPSEMIELDLDLEADLGIDSIKKIEILGSFQEQFGDLVDPALMDDMTQQKSLREITAFIMANKQ